MASWMASSPALDCICKRFIGVSTLLSIRHPNPFNPSTNLEFGILKLGNVTLKIYDMLGKEVAVIVNEKLTPGIYKYVFDGSNFASGVYLYRIQSNEFTETKSMILIK